MKTFIPHLKENGLSPQQWRVIRSLVENDGQSMSELSEACYLLKPSMSRIAQNLVSRNIIQKKRASIDQRESRIFLTKKGHKLFEEIEPGSERRYKKITDQFGSGKLELLYELLDDLVKSLDEKKD